MGALVSDNICLSLEQRGGGLTHYAPGSNQPVLHLNLTTTTTTALSATSVSPTRDEMHLAVIYEPQPSSSTQDTGTSSLLALPRRTGTSASQGITLEALDLCSFSDAHLLAALPPGEQPLKAVYKGLLVGLRFLQLPIPSATPLAPGTAVSIHRFQVKFETTEAALSFVKSIERVCPIKAPEAPVAQAKPAANSIARALTAKTVTGKRKAVGPGTPVVKRTKSAAKASTPLATPALPSAPISISTSIPTSISTPATRLVDLLPPSLSRLQTSISRSNPPAVEVRNEGMNFLARMSDDDLLAQVERTLMDSEFESVVMRVQAALEGRLDGR